MNLFDVLVLAVALSGLVYGLWKGTIRQVLSLAGVIVGGGLALRYYEAAAEVLPWPEGDVN